MLLRRAAGAATLTAVVALGLSACEEHTVTIRFDPEAGDVYRVRSDVETEVFRTVADETAVERSTSRLDATETVVAVDGDATVVEVRVGRDGAAPRTYDVRFDKTGRLSVIDLVEGVPAEALGLDLATDLPPDIASPPSGPLEPSTTWEIDREVTDADDRSFTVTGTGRVASLGVEDGVDVMVVEVRLEVPLRSVVVTADGKVTVRGSQTVESRTTYDLADGTARADRTDIRGAVDVVVEPPAGIVAPPVPGDIRFAIETRTRRVKA